MTGSTLDHSSLAEIVGAPGLELWPPMSSMKAPSLIICKPDSMALLGENFYPRQKTNQEWYLKFLTIQRDLL